MGKTIQVTINTPCHENWDAMTPVDKGRYCDSCKKQVVDFTSMSDQQIAQFFRKPSTGSVCGRFMEDQLDRDIELPRKRIPWLKYFFQITLPAFLFSLKATAQQSKSKNRTAVKKELKYNPVDRPIIMGDIDPGEVIPKKNEKDTIVLPEVVLVPATTCTESKTPSNNGLDMLMGKVTGPVIANEHTGIVPGGVKLDLSKPSVPMPQQFLVGRVGGATIINVTYRNLPGLVVDENDIPLPGVSLRIRGARTGVASDNDGNFLIKAKKGDVLIASGAGLETTEVVVANEDTMRIKVKRTGPAPKEVVVVAGGITVCRQPKRNKKQINLIPSTIKDTANNLFRTYPNPVAAGTTLTLEWKQQPANDYRLELRNAAGALVYQQSMNLETGTKSTAINVPAVTAGIYFITLTDTKTGKASTQRIIVQ